MFLAVRRSHGRSLPRHSRAPRASVLLSSAHQSQARTCMSIAKANFLETGRAFFAELRRLGQVEGQNLKVERYGREQNTSGPEALATEIVRSNPDVICVIGPGAVIFKKLTSRIPVVVITGDPVKLGIAESLAHPGGNFTGVSVDAGQSIYGKRIALLREMFPTMSKLGCLILRLSMGRANHRARNPRGGRNGRPSSRGVFTGNGYQRSRLSGGGREHLSRRCRCGHGRRVRLSSFKTPL